MRAPRRILCACNCVIGQSHRTLWSCQHDQSALCKFYVYKKIANQSWNGECITLNYYVERRGNYKTIQITNCATFRSLCKCCNNVQGTHSGGCYLETNTLHHRRIHLHIKTQYNSVMDYGFNWGTVFQGSCIVFQPTYFQFKRCFIILQNTNFAIDKSVCQLRLKL